jgi:hypothetical protein
MHYLRSAPSRGAFFDCAPNGKIQLCLAANCHLARTGDGFRQEARLQIVSSPQERQEFAGEGAEAGVYYSLLENSGQRRCVFDKTGAETADFALRIKRQL